MEEQEKADMRTVRTYDPICHDLAKRFLQDEPTLNTEENARQLATEIQQCIEDEIMYMRARRGENGHQR